MISEHEAHVRELQKAAERAKENASAELEARLRTEHAESVKRLRETLKEVELAALEREKQLKQQLEGVQLEAAAVTQRAKDDGLKLMQVCFLQRSLWCL